MDTVNTLELIEYEKKIPFVIYTHVVRNLKQDAYFDARGSRIIPKLLDHWHRELELVYVFHGPMEVSVNGNRRTITDGDCVLINSEMIHSFVMNLDYPDDMVIAFTILIQYEFAQSLIPDMNDVIFDLDAEPGQEEVRQSMLRIYEKLTSCGDPYRNLGVLSEICDLLHLLCTGNAKVPKSFININVQKNVERLRGIMMYVEEHYTEDLTGKFMAQKFYFSRGYFSKFFKQYTGISFKEYLTRYRLGKAMPLVKETRKNITEIAMEAGFSDTRRFIMTCKKYYGETPYQYRLRQVTKR